jgi:hypothetical protein
MSSSGWRRSVAYYVVLDDRSKGQAWHLHRICFGLEVGDGVLVKHAGKA